MAKRQVPKTQLNIRIDRMARSELDQITSVLAQSEGQVISDALHEYYRIVAGRGFMQNAAQAAQAAEEKTTMETIKTVRFGFYTENLWDGWSSEDMATLDPEASAREYAKFCEQELTKQYPGAVVVVDYATDGGDVPFELRTRVNDDLHHSEVTTVEDLTGQVYSDMLWVCQK